MTKYISKHQHTFMLQLYCELVRLCPKSIEEKCQWLIDVTGAALQKTKHTCSYGVCLTNGRLKQSAYLLYSLPHTIALNWMQETHS